MKIIYAQEDVNIEGPSVFLAGPTPRDNSVESWRPEVIEFFRDRGFEGTILAPEFENNFTDDFEYSKQIEWEHEALEKADIIIFWIPRKINEGMPAFTTNIEYGYWLAKDKDKIRLGYPEDADKIDYIRYTAEKEGIYIHNDYKSLVIETIRDLVLGKNDGNG